MNALLIFTILALASPIFGEEAVEQKNQQKRGVVPVGYGGASYLGGHHGYNTLNYGYNGLAHGYYNNPYYYGHNAHVAAPLGLAHGYNHGYNHVYQSPVYSAPALRVPYAGVGHNLGYYNSW